MPTRHILTCPNCSHELLIDVEGAVGGVVQDNLRLVASRAPQEVVATPAAEAHAAATGVDLSTVEGSGADGTILKSDVAAAAAEQPAEASE